MIKSAPDANVIQWILAHPKKTTKEPAGPLKIQNNRDLTPIYDPDL